MSKLLCSFSLTASLLLLACGGGETPESCASKYCELHTRYEQAAGDEEKKKAKDALNAYENEVEEKHKGDEAFFKKFEEEVERICKAG